jgi:phosphatidylglycerophosphate synthase
VLALLPLRVPPPAVVAVATATGLAATVEIVRGQLVVAAALVVLKTVLDNADGQLARATGRASAFGRYLDSESDLLVDAALFAGLGYATGSPALALTGFLALTAVLSVNFNLRRLYEHERGRSGVEPEEGGLVRRIYQLVYAPQDRAIERFVDWRLRRAGPAARLAYHDRTTIGVLHNLGLSGQMTALAAFLVAGRPRLELWFVLACGLALVPLELRRSRLATHA